jgi:hypothetical protein
MKSETVLLKTLLFIFFISFSLASISSEKINLSILSEEDNKSFFTPDNDKENFQKIEIFICLSDNLLYQIKTNKPAYESGFADANDLFTAVAFGHAPKEIWVSPFSVFWYF